MGLKAERYIPSDQAEAMTQLWQQDIDLLKRVSDLEKLCDATVTTRQIIDMVKPLAREAFNYQFPVTYDPDTKVLTARLRAVDHGSLTGLGDDDHTQYLLAAGTRALTGDWDIGNGRYIAADKIRARDGDGLQLFDNGGNGIFVEDGGYVGINQANPTVHLDVVGDGLFEAASGARVLTVQSLGGAENLPTLNFIAAGVQNNDNIGRINFKGLDSALVSRNFAYIYGHLQDNVLNNGKLVFGVLANTVESAIMWLEPDEINTSGAIVPSGGTQNITGILSVSSNLNVTGTTTLNTGLNGLLLATSGVVSAVANTLHARAHTLLSTDDHTDVATYLDQALLTTSTPQFLRIGIGEAADATALIHCGKAGSNAYSIFDCYSSTNTERAYIALYKSSSAVLGTPAETEADEAIGDITGVGVNSSSAFRTLAAIKFFQDGASASLSVPGRISLWTSANTGSSVERLRVDSAGLVSCYASISVTGQTSTDKLHVGGTSDPGDNNALVDGTLQALRAGFGAAADGTRPLIVVGAAASIYSGFTCYSATVGQQFELEIRKSHNNTSGTVTQTIDTDVIGRLVFNGVNNVPQFDRGAIIECIQNGTAAAQIPCDLKFYTSTDSTVLNRMTIGTSGRVTSHYGATVENGLVVNDTGADIDTRMEGDNEANLFYLDAGNDRIGIGVAAPDSRLHVYSGSAGSVTAVYSDGLTIENDDNNGFELLVPNAKIGVFGVSSPAGAWQGSIQVTTNANPDLASMVLTGGTMSVTISGTTLDVAGLLQCNSFRIDQAPAAGTIVCTHTVQFSANGTTYAFPCVAV